MTILLYVRRKEWPVSAVTIQCTHQRVIRGEYEGPAGGEQPWVDLIRLQISVKGDITEEQRERLCYIASRCPVHRTMENAPVIEDIVEVER